MKAKEMMIGDILNLSDNDKDIIPCKVVELHTEELLVIQPRDTACDIVGYDMVRPMILTPKILWKNCPDPEIVEWYPDKSQTVYHIHIESLNITIDGFVKYVHQLQNALRFCGLDDLANNFQI